MGRAPGRAPADRRRRTLSIDLHAAHERPYLALQGDNNDAYAIEGSLDGVVVSTAVDGAGLTEGIGLRTRSIELPKLENVRYLRVRGVGGDNFYSVSELRAYCKAPKQWPLKLILPPSRTAGTRSTTTTWS